MTTVSVVIPVHNGERYVLDAVNSVLRQTHEDLEVIVIDDGSTDGTSAMLSPLTDPRLRVIRQRQSGVAAARNRGIKESSGEVVAFLDHDDLWLAHKLATQIPIFRDPRVGVVGSFMRYLSDRGATRAVAGEDTTGQADRLAAGKLMPFPLSSMVARRTLLGELDGFDVDLANVAQVEDLDLISRAAKITEILTIMEPLGYYRVHGSAASFRTFRSIRHGTRFVKARIKARDAGSSLTWQEWLADSNLSLNSRREDKSNYLYRLAGFHIASGRPLRGVPQLVAAAALAPEYVLPRLRRQFGQRSSNASREKR
jgi:glycosyltransferase involved in cell wall biosynthesis